MCFTVELSKEKVDNERFPVAMRFGETPVPIPNTTVKTEAADDTMLETVTSDSSIKEILCLND